jgi:hypothetical protein
VFYEPANQELKIFQGADSIIPVQFSEADLDMGLISDIKMEIKGLSGNYLTILNFDNEKITIDIEKNIFYLIFSKEDTLAFTGKSGVYSVLCDYDGQRIPLFVGRIIIQPNLPEN